MLRCPVGFVAPDLCVCLQDKKKVACRHDWHQTGNNVVVTIYAKNTNPELSHIEANGTVVSDTHTHTLY